MPWSKLSIWSCYSVTHDPPECAIDFKIHIKHKSIPTAPQVVTVDMTLQRRTYSLRPLAKLEADSFTLEGSFRVYMAAQDMTVDNLATGDLICIQSESTGRRGIGIAWRATDSLGSGNKSQGNPVLRVSDLLRSSFSFELKDGYSITQWYGQLPKAQEITITIQTTDEGNRNKGAYNPKELEFWITTGLGRNSRRPWPG